MKRNEIMLDDIKVILNYIKKHLFFVLCMFCLVVIIAVCAFVRIDRSRKEVPEGDILGEYDLSVAGDGSIKATLYKSGLFDVVGSGKTKDMESIPWLDYLKRIERARFSKEITGIGANTFAYCTSLTVVDLPDGLTEIGERAFKSSSLSSITLPKELTVIGKQAFDSTKLTEITIGGKIENIPVSAFEGCEFLAVVTVEDGVKTVSDSAFKNCPSLTSVKIADSVKSIGENAFAFGKSLKQVKLGNGVEYLGSGVFGSCSKLVDIEIPASVNFVGMNAFSGCIEIETIRFMSADGFFASEKKDATEGEEALLREPDKAATELFRGKYEFMYLKKAA